MPANILVVEDEPAIQELLALNITQAGHNAIRALSVEIAQDLMRETIPDLILLDWMLPGMNGLEFARKLKSDALTKIYRLSCSRRAVRSMTKFAAWKLALMTM
jgi:two-component system phosphate regulon response regulator PhoB